MTQVESKQDRIERVSPSPAAEFDQTRVKLAEAIVAAEDGHVIEQTERLIYDQLNRLKPSTQQIDVQARAHEAEAAFFPSGQSSARTTPNTSIGTGRAPSCAT